MKRRAFTEALAMGLMALLLAPPNSYPAENNRVKPASKADPTGNKSIEALAEQARRSVVVITHFGRDGKEDGVGAGFVVSSNGLIATSLHVIGEARPIKVQLQDGRKFDVTEVHAWDRKLDLAIIRIEASDLPFLPLGNSDLLKQGAAVVAMGNPLGLKHSIVEGVVSAMRDMDGLEMIQLAIPIEPGNSGGPLLDLRGRVQGLLTMKSAMTANLGFATPINALKTLLKKPNPVAMNRWLTIGALSAKDWKPTMGARWTQKGRRIVVENPGTGFGGRSLCLYRRPVPELPYELAVTVKLDDEAGAAGLIFAADGGDKNYGFYPSGGQLRLTRFDGPSVFSWSILSQKVSPAYKPGEWNTLKVRVEKEKISCFVNGELVTEAEPQGLGGSQIGLAKFRETKAEFRDFQVGKTLAAPSKGVSDELRRSIGVELDKSIAKQAIEPSPTLQKSPEATIAVAADKAGKLEQEARQLRRLASKIRAQALQDELVKALQAPEEKIDLFHASLLIAKLDNPELDLSMYREALEDMAKDISTRLPDKADGETRLKALINYLFTENGYHGSRNDYYNRANSYINQVIDDREGIPITLSVLFIELARRIGLSEIVGVPVPAHFMVKYAPAKGEERLIDVFDGGRTVSRSEAQEMVVEYTGQALKDEHLKPATKREIILRMLRNLVGASERSDSPADSLPYLDLIIALAPDSAIDRLNRARLRLQNRELAEARQDLRWLLDHQPEGIDLDRVAELFHSL
ncbi:MAG TPA: transglutaminase family protein [Candidatus Saccharimonadales bacterium]|nr:transglutaminase family protein [Candidatus Saccharimonadales bacterium]